MSSKSNQEKTEKLFKLIGGIEYAMLVTECEDGSLRSRPMSAKTTDADQCIWFLTSKDSAKILEIKNERQVNVSFARPSEKTFVSVSGVATVTDDRAKIDEVWTSDAALWFPDGKDDPDLTLIKVEPTDAEYWSSDEGMFVSLYKMATAAMNSERPDLGTNETVDL